MAESIRTILVIGPSFFGYERSIADALTRRGYSVIVEDERPSNGAIVKAAVRLYPNVLGHLLRRHFRRILNRLKGAQLDLVLVIKGEVVSRDFIRQVRVRHPGVRIAYYAYDSFRNSSNGTTLLRDVDQAYTFDRNDACQYEISYKPLFFSTEFSPEGDVTRLHDLAFVGTVHSDRYRIVCDIFRAGRDNYSFFYSPASWLFPFMRLMNVDGVRGIPLADVKFRKMGRREVGEIFRRSRAVVDIQRSGQGGLTMRTFEALASGAKLITTNESVVQEPFYDERWILVLKPNQTRQQIGEIRDFVRSEFAVPKDLMKNYSVDAWVAEFVELID